MTTLQKLSNLSFTPGTPYVPAFPGSPAREGYWLTNTTTVVTPVWGFEDVAVPGGYGSVERVYKILRYDTTTVTTKTWVPPVAAVPPRPAIPAQPPRTIELNEGWNGGADMAEQAGADFNLSFTIPRSAIGVAVGLADSSARGDYAAIRYGLYSSRGAVQQISAGSIVGSSSAATAGLMSVRRSNGVITYWVDGKQLGSAVTETGTSPSKITAAVYMAGDTVVDAAFVSALTGYGSVKLEPVKVIGADRNYGDSEIDIEPVEASATGRAYDEAIIDLQPVFVIGSNRASGYAMLQIEPVEVSATGQEFSAMCQVTLEPVTTFGSNKPYAAAAVSLEPVEVDASAGRVAPTFTSSIVSTGYVLAAGHGLTGEVGQSSVALEPVATIAANRPYGTSSIELLAVEVLGGTGVPDGVAFITAPMGTLLARARSSAGENEARIAGKVGTLSAFTGAVASLSAPVGTVTASGAATIMARATVSGASGEVNSSATVSIMASASIQCPSGDVFAGTGAVAFVEAPSGSLLASCTTSITATIIASGVAGNVSGFTGAVSSIRPPVGTVTASGTIQIIANSTVTAPAGRVEASATASGAASSRVTGPAGYAIGYGGAVASVSIAGKVTLAASAITGGTARASITGPMATIPLFDVTVEDHCTAEIIAPMGYMATTMHAWVVAPAGRLEAIGTATVAATFEAYAVNLQHTADADGVTVDEVTRYTNFPFTHVVRYRDSYFGANSTGLYLLEGTTDAGTAIPYEIETHPDTFGHTGMKTAVSAYFSGRIDPELTAKIVAGQDAPQTYSYTSPRGATAQTHRVKFGRGVKDRYLAVGLAGNGVLELDEIELEIDKLKRRI